ncbi:MAG: two-component regulator propeller domain-containing protein [Prolixibacteraceae bacterium]
MNLRLLLIVVFSYGLAIIAESKEVKKQLYFEHLTNNDGLSSSRVNCIYEDNDGFIWFGTEDGLNLYDGVSIQVFRNNSSDSSSICNSSIYSMVCDPQTGNLWIGTRKGLCCFNKESYRFIQIFKGDLEFPDINDHIIYDLKFDQIGGLWMATSYGLYYYNIKNKKLLRYLHRSNDDASLISSYINHVFIDDQQQILVSTRQGVDLFDQQNEAFVHLFQSDSLRNVMQIMQDSYGIYWICTDEMGVYTASFNEEFHLTKFKKGQNLDLHSARIHSIIEDEAKNLFIVARDKGLYYFDRESDDLNFFEPDIYDAKSLNSKALICSFKSSSGIVWLGTFNRGINYIDINRKPFEHYKMNYKPDGLFNNNVRSFFQDSKGAIWIGTKEGGGLSRFYPESGTFDNYHFKTKASPAFSNDYILSINELDENVLMLGTLGEGVDFYSTRTQNISNIKLGSSVAENKVYAIFKDRDQVIWVAALNGLFQFQKNNQSFQMVDEQLVVKCFTQNNEDGIWMGTRFNGLIHYTNDERIDFSNDESLNAIHSNEITSLRFSGDSLLWVGTTDGLCLFNVATREMKCWHESDGLPSNRICAIELDEQKNVWMSTSHGISRFNPQTEVFKNYFIEDGLQGNDFEMYISLQSNTGSIYFGGGNGFNVFNPDKIKDNLRIPEIHFTNFKIANQSVPISSKGSPLSKHIDRTSHVELKHTQSDFTFEFVALNYTSPENNRFQYQLEGYDEDWVQAGKSRVATYTNIGAGTYTFKVIGSNNDNIWNTQGRSIQISILPPPWKSKWAYTFYLVLIGFMVMGFYFVIVKRVEQQNLLRLERHEREKMELINQLKLRFFTNISHEFRTPLTLISSPLSKLMKHDNMNPSERKYLYSTMNKNVKRLLRLMKQLMDFRKLEDQQLQLKVTQGQLSAFVHDIAKGFQEFADNNEIDIHFESNVEERGAQQWFDHNVIDSVIFNLLSNAIKFSPPNSQIDVKVDIEKDLAVIKVIDHGVGIPPEKIDKIFDRFYSENNGLDVISGTGIGLSYTRNLMLLHKGTILVESVPKLETSFEIKFPVSETTYTPSEKGGMEKPIGKTLPDDLSFIHEPEIDSHEYLGSNKRWKILVVEDNVELLSFLKNELTKYNVSLAGNGIEALVIARKIVPDLIISDVMMPEMDGVQFCSAIKSDFITSHIPVILLTAKTANEHKIEGMESGADAYIEKPFDMPVLDAQIRNLIKQRNRLRKRFSNQFETVPSEFTDKAIDQKFFEKAEKIVIENLSNLSFSVEDFGAALGMSRSQLFRKFKAITDNTPSDYIRAERLKLAKKLLMQGELNVNEISLKAGFSSTSHFISTFKKYTGLTPRDFSQK